ncbi:hypothetical protein [Rhodococcus jostii]|uniref:hypothetical protein n=1 Tax=Rhodococcus jostii TaxID=132919 RepID=UPI00363FCBA3
MAPARQGRPAAGLLLRSQKPPALVEVRGHHDDIPGGARNARNARTTERGNSAPAALRLASDGSLDPRNSPTPKQLTENSQIEVSLRLWDADSN